MINYGNGQDIKIAANDLSDLMNDFFRRTATLLDKEQKHALRRIHEERLYTIFTSLRTEITVFEQLIAVASRMESGADE